MFNRGNGVRHSQQDSDSGQDAVGLSQSQSYCDRYQPTALPSFMAASHKKGVGEEEEEEQECDSLSLKTG